MKKKIHKIIAVFLVINILFDAAFPTVSLALTGGPSQPEAQGFTPIGTSDMVSPFTGDFNYNIPLLDVGGYPINLSYQSGVSMDQEASWVGLGWSLNPGIINRNMRSLPDDFNGDKVKKEFNIKQNSTYGINFSPDLEVLGASLKKLAKLSPNLGLTYNNYTGYGFSVSVSVTTADNNKSGATAGLGISAGSESGVGISPSVSFSHKIKSETKGDTQLGGKIGLSFSSRAGLKELSINTSVGHVPPKPTEKSGKRFLKNPLNLGAGNSFTFAGSSYSPQVGHPMLNLSASVQMTIGAAVFGTHADLSLGGSYAGQILLKNYDELPAYGYMHSEEGAALDEVLLDFNREKDGAFNEHTPALPLTNLTYDVYSVSGQGIGGTYRPHRGDIGFVFDSEVKNISAGIDFPGVEIGVGNVTHPGINLSLNESNSRSGKWEDNNAARLLLPFKGKNGSLLYEPYYFKQAGEKNAENDPAFFDAMGGFDPVRIELNSGPENVPAKGQYDKSGTSMGNSSRTKRVRRNESIALLTAKEAQTYANAKQLEAYPKNNFSIAGGSKLYNNTSLPRVDDAHKAHHTSQITAYRADGAKYIYGIPAYNLTQDEKTFAIEGGSPDVLTGLVNYDHGAHDDLLGNKKGVDHYFEKTTMPAYAHSYLLTEILSADYVDVTGNGPSDDDLGTYTKINYSKVESYKWRVPYIKANYNEGMRSVPGTDKGDDKASYIYGEKELWYIHSIVTKNFVAEFTTANREDAYGVKDNQGGWDASATPSQKLMKITLYSKQDRLYNGAKATPIKTVHFEYDYSLCPGVDNNPGHPDKDENGNSSGFQNQRGKLTLKKVFFTYGNSKKGKLSPYEFTYADMDHNGTMENNPAYSLKGYDRWGNYKPNTIAEPAAENPYVEQSDNSDKYAASWHMTSVKLPSGGVINIDYEADDYAYVQDRRAMQMMKIVGTLADRPDVANMDNLSNKLYNDLTPTASAANSHNINAWIPEHSRNYLVFEIDPSVAEYITNKQTLGNAYFREKNGQEIKDFYFRFYVNLERRLATATGNSKYEFVPGYTQIENYDVLTYNGKKYGWVKLVDEPLADKIPALLKANPISQAAWHYTKLYLPQLAYDKPNPNNPGFIQIAEAILSTFKSIVSAVDGFYDHMRLEGMAKEFVLDKSFIRVYNPNNAKKGGGARVKRLALADNWNNLTGVSAYTNAEYGQEYDYTTTDEKGVTISSGVAAYEPMVGGEENPFKEPEFAIPESSWLKRAALAPSDDFYQEKPYGESFFPGPSVGYSKVTVRNLQYNNVTRHATGKVVNEFYTAKDFPTKTNRTDLNPVRKKPNPLFKLLKIECKDYMTATQGFVVELNDMHGKPKATWVYQEGVEDPEQFISGVEYKYKTSEQKIYLPFANREIKLNSLDNNFLVMEKNGTIAEKMVGVEVDFVADMREQKTTSRNGGFGGNLDAFLAAIIPAAIPSIYPSYSQEKVRFRSAVTTKIINRYGLLEETIAYDAGSKVSTKNKMLDAETGEVLLTETVNQFDDPIYNFTYPAHFAYENMGLAYKNLGATIPVSAGNYSSYFIRGDEVAISGGPDNGKKGWVVSATPSSLVIRDISGNYLSVSGAKLKVLRSGRRNQQSTPVGSITSLKNPIQGNQLVVNTSTKILNASSQEYSDKWGVFCECSIDPANISAYNPYTIGILGNWRPVKSLLYLTGRTQDRQNDNTNIRRDGIYTSFSPFWTSAGGSDWNENPSNWQFTSEVTIYSPFGPELENKDALGRYSSAIYGYNNSLPIAVSANAQYREIAFDSFEDYDFDDCPDDHFSYETTAAGNISYKKSHAGKRSIKVDAGKKVEIRKPLRQN